MGTSSAVNTAVAAFFVATILIVQIRADANHSESKTTSISPLSENISPTSPTIVDIEPLPEKIFYKRIPSILSPDIFSEPDPLTYMVGKITKNRYNGRSEKTKFMNKYLIDVTLDVGYYLSSQQFPRPYVPYAKLLSSLVVCLTRLHRVSIYIGEIHQNYSGQSAEYPPAPSDISTPELRALFSTGIFSDPDIPSVLLRELLQIPEDRIRDVKADLLKLSNNQNYVEQVYYEYMTSLRIFLQSASSLSRLRYANTLIQRPTSN
ncbi:hypothetical protein U1Q18_044366 [Sarracenia purpurea var. burkii]